MLHSLLLPKFSPRPAHLYLVKVIPLACLVSLSFLLALGPAQAQGYGGWSVEPCNAQGNPINAYPDNQGYYIMNGTESVQVQNTYPAPLLAAVLDDNYSNFAACSPLASTPDGPIPGTVLYQGISGWADAYNNEMNGSGNFSSMYTYDVDQSYGSPNTGLLNGSVTTTLSGQLFYYFKEVWQGQGAPTTVMPDHIDLLLKTTLTATAAVGYNASTQTSGLSASATASDGSPFNETASASAGDAGGSSGVPSVVGYHLVRASVDSGTGIAEVYVNGTGTAAASDTVAYGTFSAESSMEDRPTNGSATAGADSAVAAVVKQDSREVGISCPDIDSPFTDNIISANLANNYYKGPYDTQHGTDRYQHARLLSSNSVDSVVFIQNDPVAGQQFVAGHTYNSGAAGFTQPTYTWSISGDGTPDANTTANLGPSMTNPYGVANLPANLVFGSTWDPTKTKSSQFSVSVKDTDSAVGGDTYSVTWHAQQENFVVLSSQHDVPQLAGSLQPIALNETQPSYVTIPGQEGEIDWGDVQQKAGLPVAVAGAGAGSLLLIPEIASGPYGWAVVAAQAVAAGASYKLGTASPNHPGTIQLQGTADYNEYLADLQHQVTINNDPGDANNLVRFQPPLLASQALAASSGDPADWNSDPYFRSCTVQWQGGWFTDVKDLEGDGYDVNGYTGHVPGHTVVATASFKYFLWTSLYVPPPPQ